MIKRRKQKAVRAVGVILQCRNRVRSGTEPLRLEKRTCRVGGPNQSIVMRPRCSSAGPPFAGGATEIVIEPEHIVGVTFHVLGTAHEIARNRQWHLPDLAVPARRGWHWSSPKLRVRSVDGREYGR